MTTVNGIFSVLTGLETSNEEFIKLFEGVLKTSIRMAKHVEELSEEIGDYDRITQVHVEDVEFDFWIENKSTRIFYHRGVNPDASLCVFITKKLIVKILKQEIGASDVYMKGMVKLKGNLTQAIHFKNYMVTFSKYMNAFNNNS